MPSVASVQLSANGIVPGAVAGTNTPQGTRGGSPEDGFPDILNAILAGIEKGMADIKGGQAVNADGKAMTLDELLQKLFAGEDGKADPGKSLFDILQQMIAQAQAAGNMQYAAFLQAAAQSVRTAGDGRGMALHQESGNTVIQLMSKSDDGMQKVGFHMNGDSPLRFSLMAKQASLQPESDTEAQGTNDAKQVDNEAAFSGKNTGANGINAVPLAGSEAAAGDGSSEGKGHDNVVLPAQAPLLKQGGQAKEGNKGAVAAAIANDNFSSGMDMTNIQVISNEGEDAPAAALKQIITAKAAGPSALSADAESDPEPGGKVPLTGADNPVTSPAQVQQTPYGKDGFAVKETVHISRLNEVSEPIMKGLGEGSKHILIKLEPPDLGSIQIRLKMDNGVLRADFKVDSPAVKELFSMAMPQIKSSVEDHGIKAGEFFVDLKDGSYSDGREQRDNTDQQQKQRKEPEFKFFDLFA